MEKEYLKEEVNEVSNSEIAGKLMVSNIPTILISDKIKNVRDLISKNINTFDTIGYVYVIGKERELKGVLSIKDIFRCSPDEDVKSVMNKEVISIRYHTDQERAAILALKHNIKSIPVVDKENKLLGIIPPRTILKILHNEGIEDILSSSGIRKFNDPAIDLINSSSYIHIKKRLPWLIFGLIGGIIAAFFVSMFEGILARQILLAAFIPAIAYMADAVGAQAQTIFIRSIALDKNLSIKKYILREINVNFFLGIILGLIFLIFIFLWKGALLIGIIIGISVFSSVIIAMVISIVLPLSFQKLNFDPAVASGPFATAIRDLASLVIYFSIANVLMSLYF
jgi:magnesium transporter